MYQGNLCNVTIIDVIDYICRKQQPARLIIEHGARQAHLFFNSGKIVHATLGDIQGMVVIYAIQRWKQGKFTLAFNVEPPARTINQDGASLFAKISASQATGPVINANVNGPTKEETMVHKSLKEILVGLQSELPGFIAAAVVDNDGVNIAYHARPGWTSVEKIGAQLVLFIKLVETSVAKLGAGMIEDNLITTEDVYLLIWSVPETPYFLGIAVDRHETLLGHLRLIGRVYVRRVADVMPRPEMRKELYEQTA